MSRRYERARPGELLHLDIKKLARIVRPGHRISGDRRDTVRGAGWQFRPHGHRRRLAPGRGRAPARRAWRYRGGVSPAHRARDRKSTRLNSSHEWMSYAGFCLKQQKEDTTWRHETIVASERVEI